MEIRAFSLNRLRQYIDGKIPFGIVSAFRNENKATENKKLSSELALQIRSLGYGYIKLLGGYVESLDDGSFMEVIETSYLIPNATFEDISRLGKKYKQETILYFSGESLYYYDVESKNVVMKFSNKFSTDRTAVEKYFSKIRGQGKKFTFLQEVALTRY